MSGQRSAATAAVAATVVLAADGLLLGSDGADAIGQNLQHGPRGSGETGESQDKVI